MALDQGNGFWRIDFFLPFSTEFESHASKITVYFLPIQKRERDKKAASKDELELCTPYQHIFMAVIISSPSFVVCQTIA